MIFAREKEIVFCSIKFSIKRDKSPIKKSKKQKNKKKSKKNPNKSHLIWNPPSLDDCNLGYYHLFNISEICNFLLHLKFVDHGELESRSHQTKDKNWHLHAASSLKHTVLRSKSKARWGRNQVNVSEWSEMSTYRLLFQWSSVIKI